MNWLEISVKTTSQGIDFISILFDDLGANGTVIDDPKLVNEYINSNTWDYTDLKPVKDCSSIYIRGYFPLDEKINMRKEALANGLKHLASKNLIEKKYEISENIMADEDWENNWKKYFHATKIGESIVIVPSWEEYTQKEGELVLTLDPKMAFGTGTHPTTAMCIREMEKIIKPNIKVFDIGTGSGILALVAAALGAKKIEAVDYDSMALKVAKENIRGTLWENKITLKESDLLSNIKGKAHLITANLIADLIIRILPQIDSHLEKDGVFLTGGIIEDRLDDVLAVVKKNNFTVVNTIREKNWITLRIERKKLL